MLVAVNQSVLLRGPMKDAWSLAGKLFMHYHIIIISKDSEIVSTRKPENRPFDHPCLVDVICCCTAACVLLSRNYLCRFPSSCRRPDCRTSLPRTRHDV